MAKPAVQQNVTDSESFTGKLIVAAVLFIGVGFYIMDIFDQDNTAKPAAEIVQATPVTEKTEEPKDAPPPVTTEDTGEVVAVEVSSETTPEIAEVSPEPVPPPNPAVTQEKLAQPESGPVEEHFPPPPTPGFLQPAQKPAAASTPLPADQMEIIKQIFAPELSN